MLIWRQEELILPRTGRWGAGSPQSSQEGGEGQERVLGASGRRLDANLGEGADEHPSRSFSQALGVTGPAMVVLLGASLLPRAPGGERGASSAWPLPAAGHNGSHFIGFGSNSPSFHRDWRQLLTQAGATQAWPVGQEVTVQFPGRAQA